MNSNAISIFALIIALSTPASAFQCLVVSGLEKDEVHVLSDVPFLKPNFEVAGNKCQIFNSWAALEFYVFGDKKHPSKVGEKESLLILQGAHGGQGGSAACNEGDPTGDEIYGSLKKISEKFQTGAIIHSCYSGDLMERKLKDDSKAPGKSLDHLCLVTDSLFGRTVAGRNDSSGYLVGFAKPEMSLESLFTRSKGGMISSAAWDDSGVTQYFMSRVYDDALTMISKMGTFTKLNPEDQVCTLSAKAVASPIITKWNDEAMINYMNGDFELSDQIMKDYYNRLDQMITDRNEPTPRQQLAGICAVAWNAAFQEIRKKSGTITAREFYAAYMKFEGLPEYENCKGIDKLIPSKNHEMPLFHMRVIFPNEIQQGYPSFVSAYRKLKKDHLVSEPTDGFEVVVKNSKKDISPSARAAVAEEVLGIRGYRPEDTKHGFAGEKLDDVSPSSALNGFVRGSLAKSEYTNTIDQKRRNACRDFHFQDAKP